MNASFWRSLIRRYRGELLAGAGILLAIYPLSGFLHIPKWDSIIGYLPYRYFISDSIWHGHLPLWNPFQRMGYPGYADLQSGCWYPVTWLLMAFGRYDITSLMLEVIFTFLAAGLGMYTLSKSLHGDWRVAVLCAWAYALSGFMTGSTQLLVFLIGVAWLPWCIWASLRWLRNPTIPHAAALAFFLTLQITGASPAFTVVLAYILAILGGVLAYLHRRDIRWWMRLARSGALMLILLAGMLAPFIHSFLDFAPYFNRAGKLPYEETLLNPFTWKCWISFFFPFSVIAHSDWLQLTDLSLRNAYLGIPALLGIWLAITRRASSFGVRAALAGTGVIALILAMGNESPVYRWLYHLPGFGVFRHPAFFRSYAMAALILLGGYGAKAWLASPCLSRREKAMLLAGAGSWLAVTALAWWLSPVGSVHACMQQILAGTEFYITPMASHVAVNGVIAAAIAGALWLLRRRLSPWRLVLAWTFADLAVQASLTALTTMVYPVPYREVKAFFRSLPDAHDQRFNTTPFQALAGQDGLRSGPGITLNLATFHKVLSATGENPLRFRAFDEARENGVLGRNLLNPLFYAARDIRQPGEIERPGQVWGLPLALPPDTVRMRTGVPVMDYNRFRAGVDNRSARAQWVVLNQNYHPYWTARLNGLPLPVFRANELVMAVAVPPGTEGVLQFEYRSPGLHLSILAACMCGLAAVFLICRGRSRHGAPAP